MVNLVSLLVRHGADVDSLATEIAFADSEHYRTSSPLCQAAKVIRRFPGDFFSLDISIYIVFISRTDIGRWLRS